MRSRNIILNSSELKKKSQRRGKKKIYEVWRSPGDHYTTGFLRARACVAQEVSIVARRCIGQIWVQLTASADLKYRPYMEVTFVSAFPSRTGSLLVAQQFRVMSGTTHLHNVCDLRCRRYYTAGFCNSTQVCLVSPALQKNRRRFCSLERQMTPQAVFRC
jgi:hypothetical protein